MLTRSSGVLMHISSLSSPYGIGTMGKEAFDFIDFLEDSGQKYWQILPICPTSYGDSPYQSYSTFAGNPYFIDLDKLELMGLLKKEEYETIDWQSTPDRVNYGALYTKRYEVLHKAIERFEINIPQDFEKFCDENDFWLSDFALFMALKDVHGGKSWIEWDIAYRNRNCDALEYAKKENKKVIFFWKAIQYLFFKQWNELKLYANKRGISIIGDLPIYVSLDSVDVWANPELFQLDENKVPKEVAGCPPDGFSKNGQLWGNPLFDWEYMEKDNFSWWVNRIAYICNMYDVLRIDHFRGFDSYYAIAYGEETAKNGCWKKGPGMKLFNEVERQIGKKHIIAEDLGFLTDSVRQMLKDSGFPGMKVLEFAFDSRDSNGSEYLPHYYIKNCVAYTGTHDNDTIMGWLDTADKEDIEYCKEYLGITDDKEFNWAMMNALWSSVSDITIVQAQDLLGLGKEARMNIPSTMGNNWSFRVTNNVFTKELAKKIKHKMKLYGRI